MKRRLVISVLVAAGVLLAAISMIAPALTSQFIVADGQEEEQTRRDSSSPTSNNNSTDNSSSSKRDDSNDGFTEQDEFRQTYQLDKDAHVKISSINGVVEVETTDGSAAEVHIIRLAKNRDDLEYRKVIVEHEPASLVVRGESDEGRFLSKLFGFNPQVRQRVILKVPRQIELSARSVNGRVNIGEVNGPVEVSSVNGKVDVRGMSQRGKISSINGGVALGINGLSGSDGVRVSSVNGAVEVRFNDSLNADLSVSSINGKVTHDIPNMNVQGEYKPTNFRARIGEGGALVRVSSINGTLRLTRATALLN